MPKCDEYAACQGCIFRHKGENVDHNHCDSPDAEDKHQKRANGFCPESPCYLRRTSN